MKCRPVVVEIALAIVKLKAPYLPNSTVALPIFYLLKVFNYKKGPAFLSKYNF